LPSEFAHRLQIWIEQGLRALDRPPCGIGNLVGTVVSNRNYLTNPAAIATQCWIKSRRSNAPNGSLMRTHPIGIICMGIPEEDAWAVAANVSRTTHVDPRCVVSCCISVGIIRAILRGDLLSEEDLNVAIERAYSYVLSQPDLMNPSFDEDLTDPESQQALDRKEFERHVFAETFEELSLDNKREMGYVYKCLGSAILVLRRAIRAGRQSSVREPAVHYPLPHLHPLLNNS
jgi:ADP-ribosylglycohydrolase